MERELWRWDAVELTAGRQLDAGRRRHRRQGEHAGLQPLAAYGQRAPRAHLPLGVQVIGARYREDLCLDAAEVIEAQRGLPTPIDPVG